MRAWWRSDWISTDRHALRAHCRLELRAKTVYIDMLCGGGARGGAHCGAHLARLDEELVEGGREQAGDRPERADGVELDVRDAREHHADADGHEREHEDQRHLEETPRQPRQPHARPVANSMSERRREEILLRMRDAHTAT